MVQKKNKNTELYYDPMNVQMYLKRRPKRKKRIHEGSSCYGWSVHVNVNKERAFVDIPHHRLIVLETFVSRKLTKQEHRC